MMQKDHRGPETPVAEREHRTRPHALTRETREVAARWARHRSNEGFLLGKSCHVSEWPLASAAFFALTPHTRCSSTTLVQSLPHRRQSSAPGERDTRPQRSGRLTRPSRPLRQRHCRRGSQHIRSSYAQEEYIKFIHRTRLRHAWDSRKSAWACFLTLVGACLGPGRLELTATRRFYEARPTGFIHRDRETYAYDHVLWRQPIKFRSWCGRFL